MIKTGNLLLFNMIPLFKKRLEMPMNYNEPIISD